MNNAQAFSVTKATCRLRGVWLGASAALCPYGSGAPASTHFYRVYQKKVYSWKILDD